MTYTIKYTETNVGYFDIEADSDDDAIDEFWRLVCDGDINLLNTCIEDSDAVISHRWNDEEIE